MTSEFERLISDHSGRIRAIARRYGTDGQVDELYQEILEQLWRSFGSFRGESKPETWIYRISINTAMTSLRKTVKQREGMNRLNAHPQTTAVSGNRCQAEILQDFMTALNDVDASILMMYLDGLSGQEISGVLGLKVNAIQVRINRMKIALPNDTWRPSNETG